MKGSSWDRTSLSRTYPDIEPLSRLGGAAGGGGAVGEMGSKSYQEFMFKMQQPSAAGLLASMKEFVRQQLREPANRPRSMDEWEAAVQTFFQQSEESVAEHPLWAGCEPDELERACDGVEKFVMMRLHDRVFAADEEEAAEDERVGEWMRTLRFVTVDHLGIGPEFHAMQPEWDSARQELCNISRYRTPRDKLVCILNCCKRINGSLMRHTKGEHGADEFFPILIYVLLHADAPRLHANLRCARAVGAWSARGGLGREGRGAGEGARRALLGRKRRVQGESAAGRIFCRAQAHQPLPPPEQAAPCYHANRPATLLQVHQPLPPPEQAGVGERILPHACAVGARLHRGLDVAAADDRAGRV